MKESPIFASELPEWELLGVVREVSKRAKIPTPGFSVNPGMRTGAGLIFGESPIINLNPEELKAIDWTVPELQGIIAHEIGHVALGHVWILTRRRTPEENWRLEFSADDFAAKIGLGAELRSGLRAYINWYALTGKGEGIFQDSDTHPALPKRIERLPSALTAL